MKRTWVLAMVFGTLLAVSASAQSLRPLADARIPFGFTVGGASLPAGDYSILTLGSGAVLIRNDQVKKAAMVLGRTETSTGEASTQLVFHRYGESYFLSQIGLLGDRTISVEPSKMEEEYKRSVSKSVAEVSRQPEVVQIALSTVR